MSQLHNESMIYGVSCHMCQREVPHAGGLSVEGQEYLYFFCGQGCYEHWKSEGETARRGSQKYG